MRPAWRLLLTLALAACATPSQTEKGGLIKVSAGGKAVDDAFKPRRFALVLGIDHTDDTGFRPLRFASKDAQDVAAALSDPTLGAFDAVTVMTASEQTTKVAVLDALKGLERLATRPDDIVVVYISAHGTLARDERGVLRRYLVTRDTRLDQVPTTGLSMETLKDAFDALPSHRRVLVLATCHSGSGKSLLPKDVEAELATLKAPFYAPPLEVTSRTSMVLSASDWGEPAREDESLRNDIYTHFLVEALDGVGDRNLDGAVTATEAHDYARRRTYAFTQGRQHPSAEILEVGADPIVLSGAVTHLGNPELFSYSARLDGFTLKVDGDDKGELPGGAAVAPGKRSVELLKGGVVLLSDQVTVEAGERVDLDSLLQKSEPHRAVSLTGGVFGFADAVSRSQLLPAVPTAGASVRFERVFGSPIATHIELSGSMGTHTLLQNAPFSYQLWTLSLGADYLWRYRALELFAGPQVAGVVLTRSFALQTYDGMQSVVTFSPGVSGGAAVLLPWNFELSLRAQVMVAFMMVDGSSKALGFVGGIGALGYRF
jgi:hypothetical protein